MKTVIDTATQKYMPMNDVAIQQRSMTLMFTDIVGYSRLMGRDQTQTIAMLEDYRRILIEQIEKQTGTVIEFIGDAVFARFDTPLAAVNAAISIQKELFTFNHFRDKSLPRLQTRIGLHSGEVATKGKAVFGDDVNIAARLESIAVADGICVSKAVYDEVKEELKEPVLKLGVQPLKNIESKIKVYLVRPLGITFKTRLHFATRKLNQKLGAYRYPIVACTLTLMVAAIYFVPRWLVPGYDANYVEIADFKSLNKDDGTPDYFSSGISDGIRSQLANIRELYIIDEKQKMDAPLRIEGSVFRVDNNIRIEYRVFRKKNNVQIAGGKLDSKIKDVLILQDRTVGEIASKLAEEFGYKKLRHATGRLTVDLSAYDYYLKGNFSLSKQSTHGNIDAAIQMYNAALVHDRAFGNAYSGLCEAYRRKYLLTYDTEWTVKAGLMCSEALKIDPNDVKSLELMALIYSDKGNMDDALQTMQKARRLAPDSASIINAMATIYLKSNSPDKAEALHMSAIKNYPKNWQVFNDYAFYLMGRARYDDAIKNYKKVLKLSPNNLTAIQNIGVAYFYKGDLKKSAKYLEKSAEIEPYADTFYNIGTLYFYMGALGKAKYFYGEAWRLGKENPQYILGLGQSLYFTNEKVQAESMFRRAIELGQSELKKAPGNLSMYYALAISYAYLREFDHAWKMIEYANDNGPENIDLLYSKLVVSVIEKDQEKIIKNANLLLEKGFGEALLLSDPNFSILKEDYYFDRIDFDKK